MRDVTKAQAAIEWPHDVIGGSLAVAVTAVRDLVPPRTTSFPLRRLVLELADGRTLDVLLKSDEGSAHEPEAAQQRGTRERYV
jgi:hypothetical protein